jgi:hypothetical protein
MICIEEAELLYIVFGGMATTAIGGFFCGMFFESRSNR